MMRAKIPTTTTTETTIWSVRTSRLRRARCGGRPDGVVDARPPSDVPRPSPTAGRGPDGSSKDPPPDRGSRVQRFPDPGNAPTAPDGQDKHRRPRESSLPGKEVARVAVSTGTQGKKDP